MSAGSIPAPAMRRAMSFPRLAQRPLLAQGGSRISARWQSSTDLLARTDSREVEQALSRVPILAISSRLHAVLALVLLRDRSACLTSVVRRFDAPMRYTPISCRFARAVYVLALIDTTLAQGGVRVLPASASPASAFPGALSSVLFIAMLEFTSSFLFSRQ